MRTVNLDKKLPFENFVSMLVSMLVSVPSALKNIAARGSRPLSAIRDLQERGNEECSRRKQVARLAFAESVSDSRGILRDPIAAELVGQVGHIMDIKLRLDENVSLDVKLHTEAAMHLKVIGV